MLERVHAFGSATMNQFFPKMNNIVQQNIPKIAQEIPFFQPIKSCTRKKPQYKNPNEAKQVIFLTNMSSICLNIRDPSHYTELLTDSNKESNRTIDRF